MGSYAHTGYGHIQPNLPTDGYCVLQEIAKAAWPPSNFYRAQPKRIRIGYTPAIGSPVILATFGSLEQYWPCPPSRAPVCAERAGGQT